MICNPSLDQDPKTYLETPTWKYGYNHFNKSNYQILQDLSLVKGAKSLFKGTNLLFKVIVTVFRITKL